MPRVPRTTPLGHLKNSDFSEFQLPFLILAEIEILFISKTINDRAILTKFFTPRVLSTTPIAPLKNLDFFDFLQPS